jgi:hypothetical protein
MPAIKVYKAKGAMVPVEDAKVAKAYLCPWTKKIFATKASYVKHLAYLRKSRIHETIRRKQHGSLLARMWDQPDFNSIIQWVEDHPDFFWRHAKNRGWSSDAKRWDNIRDNFWVKITYLDVTYSDRVSNSHNCPRDGVTNWDRNNHKPMDYPGWHGRIEFKCSHDVPSFFSDMWEGTGIHIGTGGGIKNNRYGYSVSMFSSDWPGLRNTLIADKLASRNSFAKFTYGTPDYFKW